MSVQCVSCNIQKVLHASPITNYDGILLPCHTNNNNLGGVKCTLVVPPCHHNNYNPGGSLYLMPPQQQPGRGQTYPRTPPIPKQ